MTSKYVIPTAVLLILVSAGCQSLFAFADSTQVLQDTTRVPRFRSIQADYATIYLENVSSLSADFDLLRLRMSAKNRILVGPRLGVERIEFISFHGRTDGSPFVDYNLYVRMTSSNASSRMDVYAGYAYRTTAQSHDTFTRFKPGSIFKIGFDLKWMLIEDIFGLQLKFNLVRGAIDPYGSGGVGFFIALEN